VPPRLPAIEARVRGSAALLRGALAARGMELCDPGTDLCGIVTFRAPGEAPEATHTRLAAQGINTSVSPASYARLDLGPRGLDSGLRVSVHYYNTEGEVARFVAALWLQKPSARTGAFSAAQHRGSGFRPGPAPP